MPPRPPTKLEIPARVQRLTEALTCPTCRSPSLDLQPDTATCTQCGASGRLGPIVYFRPGNMESASRSTETDTLDRVKARIKRWIPQLYPALIYLVSPVYATLHVKEFLSQFDLGSGLVLNLGSGVSRVHDGVVNVDLQDFPEVDLVADVAALPLPDGSVDGILSIAVLEHVKDPHQMVDEMRRVLKPGGKVYCFVPFMQGIHASPDDFQRYTPHGLEELFRDFNDKKVIVTAGPSSGFVWLLQEWLALVFSLGSRRLYWLFYYLFFLITPVKMLDLLLAKHPMAKNIASGFSITASKRA